MITFIDRYGNISSEDTIYYYNLDEIIRVNSDSLYKCVDIKNHAGETEFVFKEGIAVYRW